ncbi:hypothetical protein GQX74_013534 [Glossina fuscipes]|nr:hypothetical protein GQX74_013534 [Glossina fuscipes]
MQKIKLKKRLINLHVAKRCWLMVALAHYESLLADRASNYDVNNELSPSKRRSSLILVRSSRLLFALGCKLLITTVGQGKGAGALVRIEKY